MIAYIDFYFKWQGASCPLGAVSGLVMLVLLVFLVYNKLLSLKISRFIAKLLMINFLLASRERHPFLMASRWTAH